MNITVSKYHKCENGRIIHRLHKILINSGLAFAAFGSTLYNLTSGSNVSRDNETDIYRMYSLGKQKKEYF